MKINGKRVLVCSCEATMPLDAGALAGACGADQAPVVHTQLCRAQIDRFRRAAREGDPMVVACTQEAPLFLETLEAMEEEDGTPVPTVAFANIRERAGWSAQASDATPKLAALLAEAALTPAEIPTVSMRSEGTCLVYGHGEAALEAARRLRGRLDVTVLLTGREETIPPPVADVPVFRGTVVQAKGHIGAFEVVVDGYAAAMPSSRAALAFEAPRGRTSSRCDLILDLTGDVPLFPAPGRRDGYLRPDPRNPAAVQEALFDIADLVGEFDKPRYVDFTAALCAHSRSRLTGCTRCLDVCPTGAITSAGDTVAIDPHVCAGCGSCSSVCPTGAAAYAVPPASTLLERLRVLLGTYRRAGGSGAVLLVHDARHGDGLVAMSARFGRGLPARVLPFAVETTTQVGIEFLSAALAHGAERVVLLVDPAHLDETVGLEAQAALAEALAAGLGYGEGRVRVLAEADPDGLEALLHGLPALAPTVPSDFLAIGTRRTNTRMALGHLHAHAPAPADVVPLPDGAPFGRILVDVEGCTLCLSCVGACPTDALGDDPDKPKLTFREDACIQCGLCRNTCPEKVIALEPRLAFTPEARGMVTIKEEEPFPCVRCGKAFGSRSSIERVVAKLADKHWMFQGSAAIDRIRMCEDCRVASQFEEGAVPLATAPRPTPRTTDDYLRERAKVPDSG
ncbi:4Fe-4S binding protein [Arenibaculum sp.]|uniref:4Fe-4S binding protein n=1 Tax=Arenibaculum sp. TaxID=2865862 RepID=UPI002E136856|nr:4Fe-4S binding protein [Arenibaculum sp.]